MATEGVQLRDGGCITGADFSPAGPYAAYGANQASGQYLAVKLSAAADKTVLLADAGAGAYGIIQNNPATGLAADVCFNGITKAVFGGTVAAGDKLKVGSNGQLITITSSGDVAVAETQEAGSANEVHTVHWFGGRFTF